MIIPTEGEVFKEKYCCNNDNFNRLKFAIQSSDEQLTKIIAQRGPFPRSLTYEDNSMFLKTYSNDIFTYSAFIEDAKDSSWKIDIVSIVSKVLAHNVTMQAKLACHIDDGKTKFTVSFKMRVVPEHLSGEYVTAMISCRLYTNGNLRPMKVAIGPLENQSSLHWLIIYQPLNAQISLMSVCVGPIFGNYPHVSHVAEFFTYYTTMGVETFHVYLENASQAVTFLLLHLQTRANVSIKFHWWNIENEGRHFMIHGQLAAIQDCIYRSKRSSKYVVNVDLDEFIVPTAGRTLSHAVVDLEKSVGERSLGSMLVPNWMFCFEYPANSSVLREPPFFLTTALTTRERKPWFYKVRSKYIASTSAVVMGGVHFVWKHTPGRREVKVPETVLALNHYRTCCGLENYAVLNKLVLNHTDVVRDKTIQRHMWRAMTSLVFAAIKELTL